MPPKRELVLAVSEFLRGLVLLALAVYALLVGWTDLLLALIVIAVMTGHRRS